MSFEIKDVKVFTFLTPKKYEKFKQYEKEEPLLITSSERFVLFPIQHPDIWKMYKSAQAVYWTAEEIDFSGDKKDWIEKMSNNDRQFIKFVLAFFAASDGIVNENLFQNLMNKVQYPEARSFYGFQISIENIHSEVYSLLIDTYISNTMEKNYLFNSLETIACIQKKARWVGQFMHESNLFVEQLVVFACMEGIFFCGSFCAIFWLAKRNLLKAMTFSNELISRDESLHTDFACLLYTKHIKKKLPEYVVKKIVTQAVEIEIEFIKTALPVELIGMNSSSMSEYIKMCANRLLNSLGYTAIWPNIKNPYPWMNMINLKNKGNFFETRISEYSKSSVGGTQKERELDFKMELF